MKKCTKLDKPHQSKSNIIIWIGIVTIVLICNIVLIKQMASTSINQLLVEYEISGEKNDLFQLFYGEDQEWTEKQSVKQEYSGGNKLAKIKFLIPDNATYIRLDFGNTDQKINIQNVSIGYPNASIDIGMLLVNENAIYNEIKSIEKNKGYMTINKLGQDAFVSVCISDLQIQSLTEKQEIINSVKYMLMAILIDLIVLVSLKKILVYKASIKDYYSSRQLIWNLSKNDFKIKYAGSYLGILWAFIQPVVIVIVYWFVFQIGFKSAPVKDFPFILWLVAGILPWFFFNDAIVNAANSLVEYSYLVKKVVFKISVLPIVKIISAWYVHLFFIVFVIILFAIYGYEPDIYNIQILYYMVCVKILVLGLSYINSSVVIFFKDLGQIINIGLQIGMWMTPIMWSYEMVPQQYQWVLKLNPMYYIVEGYRDSFINKKWFIEKPVETIYFWTVTIVILMIGVKVFKKLKVHFADVL